MTNLKALWKSVLSICETGKISPLQIRHRNSLNSSTLYYVMMTFFNGAKEHETININLSNKPIWISDLNVDRKVPILEFIEDDQIKVWLK